MSGWTKARDAIRNELVGVTSVNVLLVEGPDDVQFFKTMLDRVAPGTWSIQWAVGSAGGKSNVLSILDNEPDWIGIVDRDEWSLTTVNAEAAMRPDRLFVLPRFSVESYFIMPSEVWQAIPIAQRTSVVGGSATFEAQVSVNLTGWVRHGALWHAVNPLWTGLRDLGFKDALLDFNNAQDDATINAKLAEWHTLLNPTTIRAYFQVRLTTAQAATPYHQYTSWVHGKRFFREAVVPTLNANFGQKSAESWFTELLRDIALPSDLAFLWIRMGLP